MKANCRNCYYSGQFSPNKELALCKNDEITEPIEMVYDRLFKKERPFVHRREWEEPCECEHFVPYFREGDEGYEITVVSKFQVEIKCPFCGTYNYIDDVGIDTSEIIECEECDRKIAVYGKEC